MTTYNTNELIDQLKAEVKTVLEAAEQLYKLDEQTLNKLPDAGKWSLAQVVEHLNTYNRYYLPYAAKTIPLAATMRNATFKPGWLGNYFTKSMYSEVVTAKKITNRMNAFKGHIPAASLNAAAVIKEFIAAQKQLLQLLEDARKKDMASVKIPITLSKLIKISLGDTFRFLIAHQVRHLLQINNTLAVVS